jgi:HK97 family phage major capsid protein/HK97 family phage prohead protease
MKLGPLTRAIEVRAEQVKDRTIELTFSSETPVQRWFGKEVLDHSKKAARLDRLNDGAPVLFNHDLDDLRGVVEKAWIGQDKRGHALIRLANNEDGQKALDLINDNVLRNVSFMYRVLEWEQTKKEAEDGTYRVTDWEALEISLVTVPADQTVGIGRSLVRGFSTEEIEVRSANAEGAIVKTEQTPKAGAETVEPTATTEVRIEPGKQTNQPNVIEFEKKRKEAIHNLCVQMDLDERYERAWIENGTDLNTVTEQMLQIKAERQRSNPQGVTRLDLSKTDVRRYSLMRALRAAVNNDWKDAGLELECNTELSKRLDKSPRSAKSFFVPLDVMMRDLPANATQKRDMTVAGVSGSNYLVSTDNMPGNFIDLLRNTSVGLRMGVQRLSGLKGNVTIPKMTAGNTAYWLADETTQITESQPTIGQLALAPKNVAALTELSHQLMVQSSPDAENLVLQSIARDIGLAVDVGILRGSGASGQPTGIATTGSIGAFTGTSLAATGILNAVADVGTANALFPGCGFVTTHAVAALLMDRPNVTGATDGTPLWQGRMEEGTIRSYPAMASGQMSSATMLFGWWPSVILAEWGVLELMVNPFSDFTRGLTAVRGWYTCDVGVRYAGAWSYSSSIT